jgi:hypothetical protein
MKACWLSRVAGGATLPQRGGCGRVVVAVCGKAGPAVSSVTGQ